MKIIGISVVPYNFERPAVPPEVWAGVPWVLRGYIKDLIEFDGKL